MMEHEGHVVEGRVSRGTTSPKASVSQSVKGGAYFSPLLFTVRSGEQSPLSPLK